MRAMQIQRLDGPESMSMVELAAALQEIGGDLGAGTDPDRLMVSGNALVTGLDQSERQQILVRHVVRLCTDLGAEVVAEGIETADELSAVIDTGAHYAQGYLLGRPSYPLPPARWPNGLGES